MTETIAIPTPQQAAGLLRDYGLTRKDLWDDRPREKADGTIDERGGFNDRIKALAFNPGSGVAVIPAVDREDLLINYWMVFAGTEFPDETWWEELAACIDGAEPTHPIVDDDGQLLLHGQMTLGQFMDALNSQYSTRRQILGWRWNAYKANRDHGDIPNTTTFREFIIEGFDQWLGELSDDEARGVFE